MPKSAPTNPTFNGKLRPSATAWARPSSRRAVIVAGTRTPFVRAFAEFLALDSIALAAAATRAMLERTPIDRAEIDGVVWGGVILPTFAPNIAREIALDLKLPETAEGMTCTRACASGLQAITLAAAAIERGEADVMIAGGSDSTSNAPIALPQHLVHALAPLAFGKVKKPSDMLGVLAQLAPLSDLIPKKPEIAERTTGEVMGKSAERMARTWGVSRAEQDQFAFRSHQRAAAAIASGRFDREVASLDLGGKSVSRDTIVRGDTTVEKLAKLGPVFSKDGTVTAGNASSLTDGAAAVLLMSEEKARSLGLTPLAAIRSWSYVSIDPADQLLIGPAIAMPRACARAGISLKDADFVDIHEAFAAQVLCVLRAMDSDTFARDRVGTDKAVGVPDESRLNVHGGSVALGHPFGATGARMVTTMANELHASGKEFAVLGICAAGGIGASAVLEAV
jgi:acetyl-CoA acyltransferase